MSTLRTLRDAFAELERRADTLPAAGEQSTTNRSPRRRRRPAWAPLAVAAAVVVIVAGGILAGVRLWPVDNQQPAAPAWKDSISLWLAQDTPCPSASAQQPAAGAVLSYHDGCVKIIKLAATFTSPLHAQASNTQDRWAVNVTLTQQQARTFNRASEDAVGHQLAIVGDGQVLSAPIVEEPITVTKMLIAATSADDARTIARILNNP